MDITEKSIKQPYMQPAVVDYDSAIQPGFDDENYEDEESNDKSEENKENLAPPPSWPPTPVTNNHMVCPICLSICRDPIEVPCCHHWFCTFCFL